MSDEVQIVFSADDPRFYAISSVRECGIWLSVNKYLLPVPPEWRRPGTHFACVMRGRDYYRIGTVTPLTASSAAQQVESDDELLRDYRDAAWWTPGLEEAWEGNAIALAELAGRGSELAELRTALEESKIEAEELRKAYAEPTKLHICTPPDVKAKTKSK